MYPLKECLLLQLWLQSHIDDLPLNQLVHWYIFSTSEVLNKHYSKSYNRGSAFCKDFTERIQEDDLQYLTGLKKFFTHLFEDCFKF